MIVGLYAFLRCFSLNKFRCGSLTLAGTIATALGWANAAHAQTPAFTITDLGISAGDTASYATGVNNLGQIVGYDTYDASGLVGNHAETWSVGGSSITTTSLPARLPPAFPPPPMLPRPVIPVSLAGI